MKKRAKNLPPVPDFVDPDQNQEQAQNTQEEDHKTKEPEIDEIFDDLKVGKGIANALRFFGERGMLGKDKYFEDGKARHAMQTTTETTDVVVGRTKDQTLEKQLRELGSDTSQINDRVKLKYTDKEGNKLTLKQAFREMCWSFHGRAPSHWR